MYIIFFKIIIGRCKTNLRERLLLVRVDTKLVFRLTREQESFIMLIRIKNCLLTEVLKLLLIVPIILNAMSRRIRI